MKHLIIGHNPSLFSWCHLVDKTKITVKSQCLNVIPVMIPSSLPSLVYRKYSVNCIPMILLLQMRLMEENLRDHQRAQDEAITKTQLLEQTVKSLEYELEAKNHLKDDRARQIKLMEVKDILKGLFLF